MLPRIVIGYSDILDSAFSKFKSYKYDAKRYKEGERYAKQLQKSWNRYDKELLSCLSKLTKLRWHRNYIECCVSFKTPFSFSKPLTILIYKNINYGVATITHELCHILLWENRHKIKWPESNTGIYKKYKKESYNTKLHLLVHSIVILTMKKVFVKGAENYLTWERFWEHWPRDPMRKDYIRSWKIVDKEGPRNIIKELIKGI